MTLLTITFEVKDISYEGANFFSATYYTFWILAEIEQKMWKKEYTCHYFLDSTPTNTKYDQEKINIRDCIKISYQKTEDPLEEKVIEELFLYVQNLHTLMDEFEKENMPIITDILFKPRSSNPYEYDVEFTLQDGLKYVTILATAGTQFVLMEIKRLSPSNAPSFFPSPSYYFRDHIYEQIVELLTIYSSERIRMVGRRERKRNRQTFVPATYPYKQVNVHVSKRNGL